MLLFARAANTDPAELPAVILDPHGNGMPDGTDGQPGEADGFDLDEHLRGDLGAVAGERRPPRSGAASRSAVSPPVCKNMTRVIWNTPLGAYTSSTLAEIRVDEDARREARPRHP